MKENEGVGYASASPTPQDGVADAWHYGICTALGDAQNRLRDVAAAYVEALPAPLVAAYEAVLSLLLD